MGIFSLSSQDKKGNLKIRVVLYSPLPQFTFRGGVDLIQSDVNGQLEIVCPVTKPKKSITLNYDQIVSFDIVNKYNVPMDGYSGGADAVAGALMFGVVGAVVGGAIGSNIKTYPVKNCLVINFHPKNNKNEIRTLFFGINSSSLNRDGFFGELREKTEAGYLDNSL